MVGASHWPVPDKEVVRRGFDQDVTDGNRQVWVISRFNSLQENKNN